jgi:predicted RNA-binding protein YlxR (DUF448 family)
MAKHVPIRQCMACRLRRPKHELLRIVLTEAGPVLDPTGRKPGRGAYVCPDKPECWVEKKLRRFAGATAAELSQALQAVLVIQDKSASTTTTSPNESTTRGQIQPGVPALSDQTGERPRST